jgi:hypothetical protein
MQREQKAIKKIYAEITEAVKRGNPDFSQIAKKINEASSLIDKIELSSMKK